MNHPSTVTVAAGRPAVEALWRAVQEAKEGDLLAPITVVVPSTYSGLSIRRLLASGGVRAEDTPSGRVQGPGAGPQGVVNVQFLVAARITELLGAPALAAAGRRPLTAAVRAEAIRAALADAPGAFARVAGHPATERALDRAFGELRRADPEALERLAGQSARADEVVRLHRATRARLELDWYDDVDLLAAARSAVKGRSPALAELGQLIVFCPAPDDLEARGLAEAFASRATIISATLDPAPVGTRVISVSDADEEARALTREVTALARAGTPLHRIAVGYPTRRYGPLLHQHLEAAGVPHSGPGVRTLDQSVTGATLLGLLALADHHLRRDQVMGWLASAPIIDPATATLVPAAQWDIQSCEAGVVGGVTQWDERLSALREQLLDDRLQADSSDGADLDDWQSKKLDQSIERIEHLRAFVADLARVVDERGRTTWAGHAAWAVTQLERYLGPDSSHQRWPDAERESWTTVCAMLDRLHRLDALGIGVDQATFRRAVERELSRTASRVGSFGDGVFIAPLQSMAGVDVDAIFVVGLAEGVLPGTSSNDALLPDRERAAAGPSLAPTDRFEEQRRWFLTALASARHERVLMFPRADLRRGRLHLPSRWLLETASRLGGRPVWSDDLDRVSDPVGAVQVVASFAAGLIDTTEPASLLDHDLGRLLRWRDRGGEPLDHPLAAELPRLGAGLRAAAERASAAFTVYDGNVSADAVPELRPDAPLSPTALERWAQCPRRYLLERVLHVGVINRPEEIDGISAIERGSLIHGILDKYISAVLTGEPRTMDVLARLAEEAFADYEARGLTGRPLRWRYDRQIIHRLLRQFHERDKLLPLVSELGFGLDGEEPVRIELSDGRALSFKGRIDRVDRAANGSLVVTDYKTGSDRAYRTVDETTVARGTRLQLPLYALAARQRCGQPDTAVHTRYLFLAERDNVSIGYDLTEDRLAEVTATVSTVVDGITGGNFPARPGEPVTLPWYTGWENCGRCEYHKLCPTERSREWHRKRTAPELTSYVQLAEGDAADEPAETAATREADR